MPDLPAGELRPGHRNRVGKMVVVGRASREALRGVHGGAGEAAKRGTNIRHEGIFNGQSGDDRKPEFVDTSQDSRLGRIFFNRTIKIYGAFDGFFGMEDTIERIVGYFKHAAQGLEERRQILYLLGPVGGGKSSLAERLKDLMEKNPNYVLKAGDH